MAVIENLGLEVAIQVGDTALQEFRDPEPREDDAVDQKVTPVCSRYIEAKDGAEYKLKLTVLQNCWLSADRSEEARLFFAVFIDGVFQTGSWIGWDQVVQDGNTYIDRTCQFLSGNRVMICKFIFDTIKTGKCNFSFLAVCLLPQSFSSYGL